MKGMMQGKLDFSGEQTEKERRYAVAKEFTKEFEHMGIVKTPRGPIARGWKYKEFTIFVYQNTRSSCLDGDVELWKGEGESFELVDWDWRNVKGESKKQLLDILDGFRKHMGLEPF